MIVTDENRQRLEDKLLANSAVLENGCRRWSGKPNTYGYGRMWVDNIRPFYVHQIAFEVWIGPITEETIDHLCANRLCIEPTHLSQCSKSENTLRGLKRNQPFFCPKGHPYTPENHDVTYSRCRTCHRDREQERRLMSKVAVS